MGREVRRVGVDEWDNECAQWTSEGTPISPAFETPEEGGARMGMATYSSGPAPFDRDGGPHTSPYFIHESRPAPLPPSTHGEYAGYRMSDEALRDRGIPCGTDACRQGRGAVCGTDACKPDPTPIMARVRAWLRDFWRFL